MANALNFVSREIVHDDDVPLRQRRHQLLADVGEKELAVDRPVDDQRGDEPHMAKAREEGGRLPMAVGNFGQQPLAAEVRQLGRDISPVSARRYRNQRRSPSFADFTTWR